MAQDYHIYIHKAGKGDSSNNTRPFDTRTEEVSGDMFDTLGSSGSDDNQQIQVGIAMLGKVAPAVAAVVAGVKVADNVMTIGFGHLEEYTGNFQYNMELSNFKNQLNPIAYAKYSLNRYMQMRKINTKITEQNKLFGQTFNSKVGF